MELTRHMVSIASGKQVRQVHYRRQGRGPAVLMLHQSPQSSREFEPLMAEWATDFTVFAPDTPGYGLSDPLADPEASMEDIAQAVMEFADAIGLQRFGVFGYHTGGGMAVALAHAFPERITTAVANGLVMPTPEELAAILANYLPPFKPTWDGSHLSWLWARLREQTIFFPWHDHRLQARMNFAVPDADALQRNLREFLLAAEHYVVAYRAAFSYAAGPVLPQLRVPTYITAAAKDPLAEHLDRIGDRANCVKVEVSPDPDAVLDSALSQLLACPGDAPPAAPGTQPAHDRAWQEILMTQAGPCRLVRHGEKIEVLSLHDAGGSALTAPKIISKLGQVAAMDLPGHGESAPRVAANPPSSSLADCAAAVLDISASLDLRPVLAGDGTGAVVALMAAAKAPKRFRALVLTHFPALEDVMCNDWRAQGLPSLRADWHGGHLSRAWHMVRDGRLFFPWFRRNPDGIIWMETDLDPAAVQLS
ncbi:MAG: alpha/beta fold hydrolase, partial [Gammaproteobacteria bacterium]